jgi:hypothetical protein
MQAQGAILVKALSDAPAAADAAALEIAQAEVAAAAAKERRGNKDNDTTPGADLVAAVKFVHLKKSLKGGDRTAPRKSALRSRGRFCLLGPSS